MREDADRSKRALAEQITRVAESTLTEKSGSRFPRVLRIEVGIARVDPLSWLDAQKGPAKIYWADRKKQFEIAGIGQADVVSGNQPPSYVALFDRLNESLSGAESRVRYYGGIRFDDRRVADTRWEIFGSYRFILPRFEICIRHGESTLVCNLIRPKEQQIPVSEILADLDEVHFLPGKRDRQIPSLLARQDNPDKAGWRESVESAIRSFDQGTVQKIVLARKSLLEFKSALNPVAVLGRLKLAMPGCFHFCFIPEPGVAFIGASPERLYMREFRLIRSEAIAGTRPRGISAMTDEQLGQDLLHSDKDLREHRLVVQGIREMLAPLCESLEVDGSTSLLKLAQCQHLLSVFKGTLGNGVRDADLLRGLQPTPAVGGYPTAAALEEIEKLEPFDRGWYAGPVGWVGPNTAEFAVAIRSGLVDGSRLYLFSGAGIVEGSTPEGEWDEIENKISDFIKVLTDP
ncbi:MAG: isochorismate synthase MenF [Candidatus Binatia bacterium]